MNSKAQVLFFAFMLGMVVIILALAFAFPLMQGTNNARSSEGLNCSNSSITDFEKAACVSTDLSLFYFVGGLICIGGAIMIAKIYFT